MHADNVEEIIKFHFHYSKLSDFGLQVQHFSAIFDICYAPFKFHVDMHTDRNEADS